MRTIIAGGRGITDKSIVWEAVESSGFDITEVVSGAARGVDTLGEEWARANGIPVEQFPADWSTHGRAAGPIRNAKMAAYGEALIAVWDGKSKGTGNMINNARKLGLEVFIYEV